MSSGFGWSTIRKASLLVELAPNVYIHPSPSSKWKSAFLLSLEVRPCPYSRRVRTPTVRARGRMPTEVCGGAETMLFLTESSNHYQPYYSHLKTDGSNCAFWDLQQHCFFRKCLSILTRAPPKLCNLFGRECNSTEVTKNRNGRPATKRIGMAIWPQKE